MTTSACAKVAGVRMARRLRMVFMNGFVGLLILFGLKLERGRADDFDRRAVEIGAACGAEAAISRQAPKRRLLRCKGRWRFMDEPCGPFAKSKIRCRT